MPSLVDKIMKRVQGHGRGQWVCTPKDFLDLGSRDAVDQVLSRLVRRGKLRRVGRGFYDLPRMSRALKRPAPANIDSAVFALARRDGVNVMPDGIVAANGLGLTNAVPAKVSYITNGPTRTLKIDGRTVHLRNRGNRLMSWNGRPGAPVVQALDWLGQQAAADPTIVDTLRVRLPDDVKADLRKNIHSLSDWLIPIVKDIASPEGLAA